MPEASLAVIGGSGFYEIEGLHDIEEVYPDTPFGKPSDPIIIGTLEGCRVAFFPRHGKGHRFLPTEVPARANIFALKTLGVERLIAVSAVGSLREDFPPLDIVVPDQIFDRTKNRPNTFFGEGIVVHVSLADPFCPSMSKVLYESAVEAGATAHLGGSYLCMEGPQFSTRAESNVYRQLGMDIIGMTAIPEAKLAREAEMCYAMLALVTDYDCWHVSEEPVTVEMVVGNMQKNVARAKQIVKASIPKLQGARGCECGDVLKYAIQTQPEAIDPEAKKRLAPLIGKYV
jgi:5'-methylthioadenosine phosphorylase